MVKNFFDGFLRKFLLLDSIIYLLPGLLLFFTPQFFGDFFLNRKTDGVHWHLLRCVGGQLMASTFLSWRSSSASTGSEVRTACLLLRLLNGILCTFMFMHIRAIHHDFIPPDIFFPLFKMDIFAEILRNLIYFTLGTSFFAFVFLVISGWPIGDKLYPNNRWGNILYQLDTIAAIAIGLAWVLAPDWLLHRQVRVKLDFSHEFCGHLMGLFFISSHVISAHALHWRRHSDRAMAAETRAVLCLFILSAQIWSQIAYGEHWSDKHWVGISLFSTWTGIAVVYRSYLWLSGSDKMTEGIRLISEDTGQMKKAI